VIYILIVIVTVLYVIGAAIVGFALLALSDLGGFATRQTGFFLKPSNYVLTLLWPVAVPAALIYVMLKG
jgi:hypothetical protein